MPEEASPFSSDRYRSEKTVEIGIRYVEHTE